jgi:hypothetical protein
MRRLLQALSLVFLAAGDERAALIQSIEAKRETDTAVAKQIWSFAEVGYQEVKSSALLGVKGMMVAAKSMALTTVDLFTDSTHIQKAKAEFDEKRGPNFVYKTRLANRKPALDDRK